MRADLLQRQLCKHSTPSLLSQPPLGASGPGQSHLPRILLHSSRHVAAQSAPAGPRAQPAALICPGSCLRPTVCRYAPEGKTSTPSNGILQRTALLLGKANDALPYAVVASALLALVWPKAFAWFTPSMYAPALGYLMFAVGVNLSLKSFVDVFQHPKSLLVGSVGQWVVKPFLAWLIAFSLVPALHLPPETGIGLILVGCVSGAQLSNYATFLVHPHQAPLSIMLTAFSTALGVLMTPLLALLLLGTRIPVDAVGMATSIAQIVLVPIAAGLLCNRFVPHVVVKAKSILASTSLLDTCACVGASLASNAAAARSPLGVKVLLPVLALHAAAFYVGYVLARRTVAAESVPLAHCISLETGMQSSLLALLLANKFFSEPLVRLPCGLSVIVMTLFGFGLVVWWKRDATSATSSSTELGMQQAVDPSLQQM